jgi:hypothetical protein
MATAHGTDDSITTCDCCGKSNLKHTVIIELDSGEIVHYGSVCALRNTGKTRATITSEINARAAAIRAAATAEYRAHPAYIAERARFAERDAYARANSGIRMVGTVAMEFVREACQAAEQARIAIAAKYGVAPYTLAA